jgi:predicted acyltransferase
MGGRKGEANHTELRHTVSVKRLVSLDALRGLNMFWIIGAERIADAFSQLRFPGAHFISMQLNHAKWNGFTFYDLIYPMFIYVVGVSIVFAISNRRERGDAPLKTLQQIFTRTVLLFLVGLYMSNSGLDLHGWLTNLRWMGVLQRIAICYFGAAILVLFVRPQYQAIIAVTILLGYWLLLKFVPVPGFGAGVWDIPEASFANFFDKLFLPGRRYYRTWDPEGLLSTFPALVTCLFGVFTGFWLRNETDFKKRTITREKKVAWLGIVGLVLLGLGILWGFDFPINKKIWTSSFVLVTGGLSAVVMALFYWIIDIKGYKRWAFPFVVIGLNSIFIYVANNFLPMNVISRWMIGNELLNWFGAARSLSIAILTFGMEWLLLYVMYERKLFIRL